MAAPFSGLVLRPTNAWAESYRDGARMIYAGTSGTNGSEGRIIDVFFAYSAEGTETHVTVPAAPVRFYAYAAACQTLYFTAGARFGAYDMTTHTVTMGVRAPPRGGCSPATAKSSTRLAHSTG